MSEEFDSSTEPRFTAFIPLTITLFFFIVWFGYQDYKINKQRVDLNQTILANAQTITEAQSYNGRYLKLIQDVDQTAKDDDLAKTILNDMFKTGLINEAVRAGLIHVQSNGGAGNSAPPASTATGT